TNSDSRWQHSAAPNGSWVATWRPRRARRRLSPYSIALARSRSPIVCGTSSRLNPSDGHKGHFEALTDKAADAWCGTTPATDLQTAPLGARCSTGRRSAHESPLLRVDTDRPNTLAM